MGSFAAETCLRANAKTSGSGVHNRFGGEVERSGVEKDQLHLSKEIPPALEESLLHEVFWCKRTAPVVVAAAGSFRYYSEVLNNEGLLKIFREPRFLKVCGELELLKNKRVLVFETHPLLTAWLCYHARHNDVYFDGRLISDSPVPLSLPFTKIPDLENVDFVATRDRVVDLRACSVTYLTSIDDTVAVGEDRTDGQVRYWLGPPARLRFLASRSMAANVKMRLAPAPGAITLPIVFS